MNHKQKHILDAVLSGQSGGSIHWHDVESLLNALGAEHRVTHGSRMTFVLNGVEGTVCRPHHSSAMTKQDLRHLRDYLRNAGL